MSYLLILCVRFYQRFISPLFPPSCIYSPTCSTYMIQAIEAYGLWGLYLGTKRILSCHPWSEGGEDPVPASFHFLKKEIKKLDR
ncbi:membrane protein insertion efficiency factor YidD [Streptococcus danieliae]|uniref:Putative membrane protein insertion efficiency factor n=1 Tax=Streptococcus danieliae TaxID=747656 RepID=A0A7Z0M6K7_9STRE|nr:membrane protein insertion efficiency factor YidD [Streptococcus danieliae]MBF0699596.1 membrane protein insertion efficiency factor YidD [Streptococcus danieliae]NYS96772.1 membrane protein insertion efficiency factor YidD [Streptococcus danieliae]